MSVENGVEKINGGLKLSGTLPEQPEPHEDDPRFYLPARLGVRALDAAAQRLFKEKRFGQAADFWEAAASLDPLNAQIRFNIGAAWRMDGYYHYAKESYAWALALDPHHCAARYHLAHFYFERCLNAAMSIRILEEGLELCPQYFPFHYLMAQCWEDLKKPDEAVAHWEAFARADPLSEDGEMARLRAATLRHSQAQAQMWEPEAPPLQLRLVNGAGLNLEM